MNKIIIRSGCSSGIGLETALPLSKDNRVYATLRNLKNLGSVIKKQRTKSHFC